MWTAFQHCLLVSSLVIFSSPPVRRTHHMNQYLNASCFLVSPVHSSQISYREFSSVRWGRRLISLQIALRAFLILIVPPFFAWLFETKADHRYAKDDELTNYWTWMNCIQICEGRGDFQADFVFIGIDSTEN